MSWKLLLFSLEAPAEASTLTLGSIIKLFGLFGINGGMGLAAFEAVEGREENTVPLAKLTTLFLRLLLEFVAESGMTADS